jgi:hypothetical protein
VTDDDFKDNQDSKKKSKNLHGRLLVLKNDQTAAENPWRVVNELSGAAMLEWAVLLSSADDDLRYAVSAK